MSQGSLCAGGRGVCVRVCACVLTGGWVGCVSVCVCVWCMDGRVDALMGEC